VRFQPYAVELKETVRKAGRTKPANQARGTRDSRLRISGLLLQRILEHAGILATHLAKFTADPHVLRCGNPKKAQAHRQVIPSFFIVLLEL
jgi:hypothetical protein